MPTRTWAWLYFLISLSAQRLDLRLERQVLLSERLIAQFGAQVGRLEGDDLARDHVQRVVEREGRGLAEIAVELLQRALADQLVDRRVFLFFTLRSTAIRASEGEP